MDRSDISGNANSVYTCWYFWPVCLVKMWHSIFQAQQKLMSQMSRLLVCVDVWTLIFRVFDTKIRKSQAAGKMKQLASSYYEFLSLGLQIATTIFMPYSVPHPASYWLSLSPPPNLSTDVSPGLTIWLFTWRGTSRAGWAPSDATKWGGKKVLKRGEEGKKNVNKRRLPTSLLVELSQSRVAGECSSQSMPFCTILKPSASGTSLRRKALWRSSVATRGQNHGWASFFCRFFLFVFSFWIEKDLKHTQTQTKRQKTKQKNRRNKKKRQLKSEWFVRMVHDVLGTSPRQQIHWYFTKLSEASMCALWMSAIGYRTPLLPIWKREERKRRILGGKRDGIGGWAGTDVAVDWAFWEKHSACVSLVAVWGWGRKEAPACLPVLCGNQTWVREGGGPASLKLARPWVWPEPVTKRERERCWHVTFWSV